MLLIVNFASLLEIEPYSKAISNLALSITGPVSER